MKKKIADGFVLISIFLVAAGFGGAAGIVKDGNRLFHENKFDDAMQKYSEAQLGDPDNPRLDYNIGSAFYKQKKYDLAAQSFEKVINSSFDNELKAKAYYNAGNAYFKQAEAAGDMENLQKSIDAYTEALKFNPEDEDAKYNLEVARQMLELKKQEQDQKPQSCQNPNNKSQDGENKQSTSEAQIQPKESDKSTSEARMQPKESKQSTSEQQMADQSQIKQEGEMSKEEADRLLMALDEKERQDAREEKESQSGMRAPFAGKDW